MRVSKHALLKAIDRTKLVPVEVPIRTKFGMTRGIRYKNPKTAINQTAKDIASSRSDIKSVEDIEFKNKATGKVETLDQVAEAKQKAGGQQTMQQFVSQNYSIGKKGGGKQTTSGTKGKDTTSTGLNIDDLTNDLTSVDFDSGSDLYTLEFNNGEYKATVRASDYPEAATDEYYFDEPENIKAAIIDSADEGNFEDIDGNNIEVNTQGEKKKENESNASPNIDELMNNLTYLYFNKTDNTYTLDFYGGKYKATVDADKHPQAMLDIYYFDKPKNIKTAIKDAMENGNFEINKEDPLDKVNWPKEIKEMVRGGARERDLQARKDRAAMARKEKYDSLYGPIDVEKLKNDLTWVDYDSGNNTYTLEFNNGEYKATVDADEYTQAATDEGYFDDPDNIKTAIRQAMNEGTFESNSNKEDY